MSLNLGETGASVADRRRHRAGPGRNLDACRCSRTGTSADRTKTSPRYGTHDFVHFWFYPAAAAAVRQPGPRPRRQPDLWVRGVERRPARARVLGGAAAARRLADVARLRRARHLVGRQGAYRAVHFFIADDRGPAARRGAGMGRAWRRVRPQRRIRRSWRWCPLRPSRSGHEGAGALRRPAVWIGLVGGLGPRQLPQSCTTKSGTAWRRCSSTRRSNNHPASTASWPRPSTRTSASSPRFPAFVVVLDRGDRDHRVASPRGSQRRRSCSPSR